MKNYFYILLFGTMCMSLPVEADHVKVSTPNTELLIQAKEGSMPQILYYGARLSAADEVQLDGMGGFRQPVYPVYGLNSQGECALEVTHGDGSLATSLVLQSTETRNEGDTEITVLHLKDRVQPFYVDVCYKAYQTVDMIETWTEIHNEEKKPASLMQYASAYLPVRRGNVWLSHLYGSWANEGRVSEEPLQPGMKVITNRDGTRNSHTAHAELMLSLDGKPQENSGRVIGAALCYSGNYRLRINTDDSDYHHLLMGICETGSTYHLKKGETFRTPAVALTYSNEGLGGASRNLHKWGRKYRLMHGDRERKILLNSWEGVYFNITEEGMQQMMDDIAMMGGELFVMDDGWFGGKYQRNSDDAALGDWVVDIRKLPNGIGALCSSAAKKGIKFGIWIEPEMTNTTSELYEQHPDWVLKAPGYEPERGRGGTQLVLDLANPKVQDFIFGVVDNLMTENPDIDYIKWDSNMGIQNHGSQYLTNDNQSHLYIEYHRGFEKVCQRIREKYPDLTIQACASGGARANWGVLPWFDEFWVSDDTDALQRIYMQWGTSYFFPAIAMGSHIASSPNHQTFRSIPLKYRIDVAMSGRLGMEIQPKNMTEEEKAQAKKAIAEYKQIRPIVQFGDLYRLHSPYEKDGVASLMYVSEKKDDAVFYWWKTETFCNQHLPRIRMAGLNPDKMYTIHELGRIDNKLLPFEGKQLSGRYLMENGLEIPYTHDVDYNKQSAWSSRVLRLSARNAQNSESLTEKLVQLQERGVMFGHQDDTFYGLGWQWDRGRSDVLETCGDYPAVMGFDLGGIEMGDAKNLDSVPFTRIREEILAQVKRGGIVAVSWHPRNPLTTIEGGGNAGQPFPKGTAWDVSASTVVRQVLPGEPLHEKFQLWMQRLSAFLQSLKDEDGHPVPLIFRPWHENNGSWFWWGKGLCTAEEYKALWNMLQDYLRHDGLENLVWSWSPNLGLKTDDFNTYPGDDRVDIIGLDAYQGGTEQDFVRQLNEDLTMLTKKAVSSKKLIALTECGYENIPDSTWWTRVLLPNVQQYQLSYFLVWRNAKSSHHFASAPGTPDAEDFCKMVKEERILMLKDLQK